MSNVVNLNRFRKKKERAEDERRAAENREKFGCTKAEKEKEAQEKRDFERHVDGHERTPEDRD